MTEQPTFTNVTAGLALHIDVIRLTPLADSPPPVVTHYPPVKTNPFERSAIDRWRLTVHHDRPEPDILTPDIPVFGPIPHRRVSILIPGSRRAWDLVTDAAPHPHKPGVFFAVETWSRFERPDPEAPWSVGEPWTYLVFPRVQLLDFELDDIGTISTDVITNSAGGWGTGHYPDTQLPQPLPEHAHSALRLVHTMPPAPTT